MTTFVYDYRVMVEWNEQDFYDKIFETRSRKSQFVKRINALCITQYYDERQSQYEGITIYQL